MAALCGCMKVDGVTKPEDWRIEPRRTIVRPAVAGDAEALHASRGQMPFVSRFQKR